MKRIKRNSLAKKAAIQRGIAAYPNADEWTAEDFVQARRTTDTSTAEMLAFLTRYQILKIKMLEAPK